jgi:hypothetical protein
MNARYAAGPRMSLLDVARLVAVISVVGFFVVRGFYASESTRTEARNGWVAAVQAGLQQGDGSDGRGAGKRPQPRGTARLAKAK